MAQVIKNFRHVCVVVKDLDRALRFYQDILGLKLVRILTAEGEYLRKVLNVKDARLTYAKLRVSGQPKDSQALFELHCWQRPKPAPMSGCGHVSFTVENIEVKYKRLKKAGVRFIWEPVKSQDKKRKICFAYDPDGNLIEFIEDLKTR